jgi:hypothetical protein
MYNGRQTSESELRGCIVRKDNIAHIVAPLAIGR